MYSYSGVLKFTLISIFSKKKTKPCFLHQSFYFSIGLNKMVHLEKVQGQRGHMIISEDGTILSSSGELASGESTANQIASLMSHSLPVDFNATNRTTSDAGHNGEHNGDTNGSGDNANFTLKWNRITVQFDNASYIACLSNSKIQVVKRDNNLEQLSGATQ